MRSCLFALVWVLLLGVLPASAQVVRVPSLESSIKDSITLDPTAVFRQRMATPVVPVPTPGAGTDLVDGVYVVGLTAIDAAGGETAGGPTATCTVTAGGAGGCSVAYTAVTGAESYRVYISAVDGAAPSRYFTDVASPLNIITLTGATVVAYPSSSTAYVTTLAGDGSSWFKGGTFLRGIGFADSVPATTTNQLYNDAGTLKFNGSAIGETLTGTANQIIKTGTVLSTPQDIGTTSAVNFGSVTVPTATGTIAWGAGTTLSDAGSNGYLALKTGVSARVHLAFPTSDLLQLRNSGDTGYANLKLATATTAGYESGARATTSALQSVTEALALSGASTATANIIPAGATVEAISTTTTTTITGASGYQVGDGVDADRYGDITGTAVGTVSGSTSYTADPRWWTNAARAVTLTAKTSNFTGGVVQVTVFYRTSTGT